MDKQSFILGMITAFCECVAGGCKRLALSPPMARKDYLMIRDEGRALIARHGLICHHEDNADLPPEERVDWLLIAAEQKTLDEYLALRAKGHSPVRSLEPFYALLSYDPSRSISTGYDAYRDYFGA